MVVLDGPDLGAHFEIAPGRVSIGRSSGVDITVDDEGVSRKHAELQAGDKLVVVLDLESRNGTWVNERQVSRCALESGDLLRVGETTLKFLRATTAELRYHVEMWKLLSVDSLTGAHGKRFFLRHLERELSMVLEDPQRMVSLRPPASTAR